MEAKEAASSSSVWAAARASSRRRVATATAEVTELEGDPMGAARERDAAHESVAELCVLINVS
jgi:hypothetical protein